MSVRQNNSSSATTTAMQQAPTIIPQTMDVSEVAADTALAEGNNYNVVTAEQPLKRNVVVSIKSTLNDLCLQVCNQRFPVYVFPYRIRVSKILSSFQSSS